MKSKPSFYLVACVALALGRAASAQPTFGGAPPQSPVIPTLVAQPPSASVGVPVAPAANSRDSRDTSPNSEANRSDARILRGNDRVLAAPKAAGVSSGAAASLNFEEAPIAQVVRTVLGDILQVDYVLHPPLAGTVTLATRSAVSPDQAVFLLESALQASGLGLMTDARGTYHVGRPDVLRAIGGNVRQATGGPLPPGQGVVVVPLEYIGASEMAAILRPMMPSEAIVRVDNLRNLLVLAGTRTQAEGWLELVKTFDVDLLKGMSVGVFPLKYASIREVEAALALVSGGGGGVPTGGAAVPARGNAGQPAPAVSSPGGATALGEANPLFGAIRIMPIARLNSILVVTPRAAYLDEARRWIERLDQPGDNGAEAQLHIYKVQNGNARHLASVLGGIFGGAGSPGAGPSGTGVAPGLSSVSGSTPGNSLMVPNAFGASGGFTSSQGGVVTGARSGLGGQLGGSGSFNTNRLGAASSGQSGAATAGQGVVAANIGSIRVMADELNNSILVWGTRSEYAKIETTLKRLDLPPTQVLIEATIVEVTLGDGLEYGLQWAFNDSRSGSGYTGAGRVSGLEGGALGGLGRGFTYTLSNPLGNVRAVLNALATKSLIKVISSPTLMVLDNHTAAIAVGNQQPIKTSVTSFADSISGATTSTIQYKDTGVNLVVTPSVNAGNLVTMQVDQTVTDVGETITAADGQPAFLQRQISSKVAVRSGEAIVLGGLIKDNATRSKAGVPFLQDVPVFGNLFGTNNVRADRTELLVVITPRVVRTDIDIREVSDDLRDRLRGLSGFTTLGVGTKPASTPSATGVAIPTN